MQPLATCPRLPRATDPAGFRQRLVDGFVFFGRWLRDPAAIASIVPSGRALATRITAEIDGRSGPVLELGSGTGAFVPAILRRGVTEHDLVLVERDPVLAHRLAQRYRAATVLTSDAAAIGPSHAPTPFGAVVCGLGLLNMPAGTVEAILRAAFARMAPDAGFYLFTYGRRCSVPTAILDRLDLRAERVGTAWRNLPPATVYRLTRRPSPPMA